MRKTKATSPWGQSLWIDNYSREFLYDGSLMQYLEEFSITGISLNSESLEKAATQSTAYDSAIQAKLEAGMMGEKLACSLVIDDVRQAANQLRHIHDRTSGVDGWASLPASPFAGDKPENLIELMHGLKENVSRRNVLVRLPLLPERIPIVSDLVYRGIPVNITNVYDPAQLQAVAEACLHGIEKRIEENLKSAVPVFICIGVAALEKALGRFMEPQQAAETTCLVAKKCYDTIRSLQNSPRWEAAYNSGARPLRLIWNCSSFGNETELFETVHKLNMPLTVITLPKTVVKPFLQSRADWMTDTESGYPNKRATDTNIQTNIEEVATVLQQEVLTNLRRSWIMMLEAIARKSAFVSQQKISSI